MIINEDKIKDVINKLEKNIYTLSIMYLCDGVPTMIDNKPTLLLQSIGLKNEYMVTLRDSITYKLGNIHYHFFLLNKIKETYDNEFCKMLDDIERDQLFYVCVERHMYITEDIVYHLISLFDYLGNLAGFIHYGDSRRKLKWNGLVRCCKNPGWELKKTNFNKIYNSGISKLVVKEENEFVNKLQEFRAELIHYRYHLPGGNMKINPIDPAYSSYTVYTPKQLMRIIKDISYEFSEKNAPIIETIGILIRECCSRISSIVDTIREDLTKIIRIVKVG